MRNFWIVLLVIASFVCVGCHNTEHRTTDIYERDNNSSVPGPQINPPQSGSDQPSWVNDTLTVTGDGAVNPAHMGNPGQMKLMAKRAAITDGRRKLLEQVLGLTLDSKTVIRDMVAEADQIYAETNGFIRSSAEVPGSDQYDGQTYSIQVQLKLYNVYQYMKTKRIYYK